MEKNFKNLFNLTDRVAIVIGGAGGIGQDIMLGLSQYGCDVICLDLNTNIPESVQKNIKSNNVKFSIKRIDIANEKEVKKIFEKIYSEFGKIDILINAAGINKRTPITKTTENDWDKIIDINLKGAFFTCKHSVKYMKNNQYGKIINIGSVSSVLGHPNHGAYAASKGGLLQLTKVLATELAQEGINVNCIGPAYIETELTKEHLEAHKEKIVNSIPMNRLGKTDDIVGSIIYLSSQASDFVTGSLLLVDGGRTAD